MADLTYDEVALLLNPDFELGKLVWRHRPRCFFQTERSFNLWNLRHAGQDADGCIGNHGYRVTKIHAKGYVSHRVLWLLYTKKWPSEQIDHINGIRSDNRIINLREVSGVENCRNQKRYSTNNSGVVGVSWYERYGAWVSYIRTNGRRKHLGYFHEFDAAVARRKAAEVEEGFHPNHGRDAA